MIFHKFGGPITIQEVEDPIPGENDAVIKVRSEEHTSELQSH